MVTYNSIIKGFTKTIDKLEALATKNADKEAKKTKEIKSLKAECIALEKEGAKAMNTAAKLKGLLE